jgi:hypothetical protein
MYGTVQGVIRAESATGGFAMLRGQSDCSTFARRAAVIVFVVMGALSFLASMSQPAQSQTYKVIHNFT